MASSKPGDFGYGSTVREYRDDPDFGYRGTSRGASSPYQGTGYGNFTEVVDQITSNLFKINNNATTIERTTKQVGTDKDSTQLRDKIHMTEQGTNIVINETTRLCKQLSSICSRADRSQKLQFERLTGEFKVTIKRYSTLQKIAADKVKTCVVLSSQKPQQPQNPFTNDLVNWGDAGGNDDDQLLLAQEGRREQMMIEQENIEADVALLQERENQIRQLESDIIDINEIFRDLGTLVAEQGEVISSIEDNVEAAHTRVEEGNEELLKASNYQAKARRKKCILLIIVAVIVAIIVTIIVISVKTSGGGKG